jgi:hypothetical protein
MAHKLFVAFLLFMITTAAIAVGIYGWGYYWSPLPERPFRTDYDVMKPSAPYSHGLGIFGASMITVGVTMYSTRKRVRALWNLGKLSRWLEIHIFLCLLGPVLVVYHTTFKAGGIAAISLWTMLSVAASGIVGRFLYVQIPRNMEGNQLTFAQISGELDKLALSLSSSALGAQVVKRIYQSFESLPNPKSLLQAVATIVRLISIRLEVRRSVRTMLSTTAKSRHEVPELSRNATSLAALYQKTLVLSQVEKLFYYWHVIHLPFSLIMFITLAAHITVEILLGYKWIF